MSLTHHFPQQADAVNGWIVKSGFPNDEESSVRLALEVGPIPADTAAAYARLDAAWKRVQAKPVPSGGVDVTGLLTVPAANLVAALRMKIESPTAPRGLPKGQMLNALSTFMRVSQPWISFEGR
jgi:hypothetical protein